MKTFKEKTVEFLEYIKQNPYEIRLTQGRVRLVPIQKNYKNTMPQLPELLGRWRKENPSLSTSVFNITLENTTFWLEKLILGREDRILFMIEVDGKYVGHIGYSSFNWEEESAEIDCVLRGEVTNVPRLMTRVLAKLLDWGKETLNLKEIYLSTEEKNAQSQALYTRCGFQIINRIPLFRWEKPDGEIRWDYFPDRDPKECTRWGVYMKYMGRKDE